MRLKTTVRGVALGAALTITGLLGAGLAQAATLPVLGGVTKLTGAKSAYVRVSVNRAFTMNSVNEANGKDATVAISGPGTATGLVLLRDGSTTPDTWNGFFAYRVNASAFCHAPACAKDLLLATALGTQRAARQFDIPAGTYRMYVFGDGPIGAELRIPGRSGTVRLSATHPVTAKARELPRLDPGVSDNVTVFGASDRLMSAGLLLSVVGTVAQIESNSHREACVREGDFAGDPLAFYPVAGCTEGGGSTAQGTPGEIAYQLAITETDQAGVNSLGGNVTAGAVLRGVGAAGAWISFDK